MQVQVG